MHVGTCTSFLPSTPPVISFLPSASLGLGKYICICRASFSANPTSASTRFWVRRHRINNTSAQQLLTTGQAYRPATPFAWTASLRLLRIRLQPKHPHRPATPCAQRHSASDTRILDTRLRPNCGPATPYTSTSSIQQVAASHSLSTQFSTSTTSLRQWPSQTDSSSSFVYPHHLTLPIPTLTPTPNTD